MTREEKVRKIFDLSMQINGCVDYDYEKRTLIFLRVYPHCGLIEADIHYDGWDISERKGRYIQTQAHYSEQRDDGKLDGMIAMLESVIDGTFDACNPDFCCVVFTGGGA